MPDHKLGKSYVSKCVHSLLLLLQGLASWHRMIEQQTQHEHVVHVELVTCVMPIVPRSLCYRVHTECHFTRTNSSRGF